MENELKAVIAVQRALSDLTVIYDDLHGLWGGNIFTIRGDGSLERQTKSTGSAAAEITQKQIDEHKLIELVCLLVKLTAWEQYTPDSQPVPNESRAQLTISINGKTSRVWERFNEMPTHNRLLQVKNWINNQLGDEPQNASIA